MMTWIAMGLILVGVFFLIAGSVGMLRLPEVFSRAHALGVIDSLGALFVLGGLALYEGFNSNFLRIGVVLALVYLLNPVIAHATIRAAYRSGLRPAEVDDK